MIFKDAYKLHKGDEVIDKKTGESIYVICAWDEPVAQGKRCIVIEGTGEKQGYNHWDHKSVK